MSKAETEQKPAGGDIQSIKEAIQSLALELWLDKRNTIEGMDWLVDGRLMAQLDELSKSQLFRVERILGKVVKVVFGKRYMTAGSA